MVRGAVLDTGRPQHWRYHPNPQLPSVSGQLGELNAQAIDALAIAAP